MSLSFPRSSKLVFQFWLHLWFTGHWDSISLNLDSFYHWSLQFASSNRIAVNHFPAENINCHKLRIYQSIFRECFASLIIYDFAPSNRLAFALGLATIQADRSSIDRSWKTNSRVCHNKCWRCKTIALTSLSCKTAWVGIDVLFIRNWWSRNTWACLRNIESCHGHRILWRITSCLHPIYIIDIVSLTVVQIIQWPNWMKWDMRNNYKRWD